nr:hypothetical protein [Burkholderia sp. S-53]
MFRLVDRELTPLCAVLIPAAAEVDRLVTLLLVVFTLVDNDPTSVDSCVDSAPRVLLVVVRLVDREVTPLCAVLMPAAADVDRLATLLFVVFRPVDNELTLSLVAFTLVDSDPTSVDS